MGELKVLRNSLSYEERIQARIDSFAREVMMGDGDIEYVEKIMNICLDYLSEYEENDVYNATIKLKESIFYLDCFLA